MFNLIIKINIVLDSTKSYSMEFPEHVLCKSRCPGWNSLEDDMM